MAAAPDPCAPDLVDLCRLRVEDLDPVLEEERLTWRSTLSWDFHSSAELVRRFLRIQALNGYALVSGDRIVGYSYQVCEDRKGLVGDLYLLREFATPENEACLLDAVLQSLLVIPHLQRIEAQLMMMRGPSERPIPLGRYAQAYPRIFMLADLDSSEQLQPGRAAMRMSVEPWTEAAQDESAVLIAAAYNGHIDSCINDQYRSYSGARRFLHNIVQYPGCGTFFSPASLLARDANGRLIGLVLSSLVAPDVGHITQICVAPEAKSEGIGYELMRHSLAALKQAGCEKTSLTVTASNANAIRLYQMLGFRAMRRFSAYVWEGF